jgi:peptide/nickel transport system substrate-binding protein
MTAAVWIAGPASAETVIHYVPQADINVLDPVANHSPVVTQFGYMVYDQLFGIDSNYAPHPQMVDTYTASDDAKNYEFTLRDGLKFNDGAPVTSADVIASIQRWAKGDPAGQKMVASGMKLEAVNDKTFKMTFEKPFGQAIDILAKPSWPLFIFPERNALHEPSDPVTDAVGSGPFKFVHEEWEPGAKVVFVRNPDYVSRSEPADAYSGGKVVNVDRVEWHIIRDPATAVAALQNGEVDAVESIPTDFATALKSDDGIVVSVFNKIGLQAYLRFNNIQPPFDNKMIRQALKYMVNQEDYMRAMVGDPDYWATCWAWMMCNSPNGSDIGTEDHQKPDLDKARQLLKDAGYNGENVVVLTSTGIFGIQEEGQVLVQELKSIGMNVVEEQIEFNTMLKRRLNSGPVEDGGWSIIPLWSFGPDLGNPLTSQMLTAPCEVKGWPGWACDPKLEQLVDEWAAAPNDDVKREKALDIQREAADLSATIPLGEFFQPAAYSKKIEGMLSAPYPIMWNIKKAE